MANGYGPYKVGELVYTLVRTWGSGGGMGFGNDCGLLYGMVTKAGPKTWEVVWESGHRARYRQNSLIIQHTDASDFGGDPEFQAQIESKLRQLADRKKG